MNQQKVNFILKTDFILCKKALLQYDISEYTIESLKKGMNTIFFLKEKKNNKEYVLRISPSNWLSIENINSEAIVIEYLNKFHDILTSKIFRNSNGNLISVIKLPNMKPQVVILFERISFSFYEKKLSKKELMSIGRDIAKLHNYLTHFEKYKLERPVWNYCGIFDRGGVFDFQTICQLLPRLVQNHCFKALKYLKVKLDKIEINQHNFGFIHGDTYYRNIFRAEDVNGFIDFDMCGWGYYLNDIYNYHWPENQYEYCHPNKVIIEGYSSIRTLPDYYDKYDHVFCIMQHLINIFWAYSRNDIIKGFSLREKVVKNALYIFTQYL